MRPIHLAFVDDWELRGDGSGDPSTLQFAPISRLTSMLESRGVRGSFNVEVMQQFAFREQQARHAHLGALADQWEAVVSSVYSRGHDIQLHLHPQWSDAAYDGHRWHLSGDWAITKHEPDAVDRMVQRGITYLTTLLRPVNDGYGCVSFRSGSWALAPSDFVLDTLARHGIQFDMSIVAGVRYRTRNLELDYTEVQEPFLPYYPDMTDARRVSPHREPIIIVPTNRFLGKSRLRRVVDHPTAVVRKIAAKVSQRRSSTAALAAEASAEYREWQELPPRRRWWWRGISPGDWTRRPVFISDLAQLTYPAMVEMLSQIRAAAERSGHAVVPVILENHTKDIQNWQDIDRFVGEIGSAADIDTVTLTDIATGLRDGLYPVRRAS